MLNARTIRKCGENPSSVNQVPVLGIATCGFVGKNRCVLGEFRFSPHFSYAPGSQ